MERQERLGLRCVLAALHCVKEGFEVDLNVNEENHVNFWIGWPLHLHVSFAMTCAVLQFLGQVIHYHITPLCFLFPDEVLHPHIMALALPHPFLGIHRAALKFVEIPHSDRDHLCPPKSPRDWERRSEMPPKRPSQRHLQATDISTGLENLKLGDRPAGPKPKRNIVAEFDEYIGNDNDLANWQRMCRDVGIKEDLRSKTQCRKVGMVCDCEVANEN